MSVEMKRCPTCGGLYVKGKTCPHWGSAPAGSGLPTGPSPSGRARPTSGQKMSAAGRGTHLARWAVAMAIIIGAIFLLNAVFSLKWVGYLLIAAFVAAPFVFVGGIVWEATRPRKR